MNPNNTTILDMTKNRGTGAGGSNTNKNGLQYETLTELNDKFIKVKSTPYADLIKFNISDNEYYKTQKTNFLKLMSKEINSEVEILHGCKQPDECYIKLNPNIIFFIEKKFQNKAGSVCEKLQTAAAKIWCYENMYPNYKIVYIYCLSDWFKTKCKGELQFLDHIKCRYFWGSSKTYKDDIINFIVNYK